MFRAGRERSEELEKRRREGGIPIRPRAARCEDTAFVPARQCPSVGRIVEVVIMVVLVTRVRVPQFPLCGQNRNICLVRMHMGRVRCRRRLVQRELFHLVVVSSLLLEL